MRALAQLCLVEPVVSLSTLSLTSQDPTLGFEHQASEL